MFSSNYCTCNLPNTLFIYRITNEQLTLTEKKVKLVKPSWWENKWLYFGYGATLSYAVFTLIDQIGDSIKLF